MRLWVLKNSMEREKGIKERTAYVHINNIYVECLWFFVFLFLADIKISGHCMPRTHLTAPTCLSHLTKRCPVYRLDRLIYFHVVHRLGFQARSGRPTCDSPKCQPPSPRPWITYFSRVDFYLRQWLTINVIESLLSTYFTFLACWLATRPVLVDMPMQHIDECLGQDWILFRYRWTWYFQSRSARKCQRRTFIQ